MIEMWDDGFQRRNPAIRKALKREDGLTAFRLMQPISTRVAGDHRF